MIGLYKKTSGQVFYRGKNIHALKGAEKKAYKKCVQMVFQDAYSSLDPRMTVADIVAEGIDIHGLASSSAERTRLIHKYLDMVGLSPEHASRFPHEFSGGQRQRIGIARALAVEPEFLFLDEPVSALDVSIQAQIVNLLMGLQTELGLTYLFVAHDLSIVHQISDRIAVMYLGNIVELTDSVTLYANAWHPYTKALFSAVPIPDPDIEAIRAKDKIILDDESLSAWKHGGCKFFPRCRHTIELCKTEDPLLTEYAPNHWVACHLASDYRI
ncbi:MAG: ATP-binding cassette domain-containing protein [Treponema sp.]|jgi:oligopeptide transport system ATP-binding protein|nr:ATP-binding cassette domain-containing protein [Treponema sp.]